MHHATAATTSPTDEHATFVQLGGNERRDGCGGYIGSGDHATTATAATTPSAALRVTTTSMAAAASTRSMVTA